MAAKRGTSGLSLLVGVKKPSGMSSHDVVNKVRRIFDERRVGHAGTLDPMAEGVLPIMVGSATRLDAYMTGHDKTYVATIRFGFSTTTDDAEGEVLRAGSIPSKLQDPLFASEFIEGLAGKHTQMPPAFSAIKVQGKKACDEARRGNIIKLEPREIEIYHARFLGFSSVGDAASLEWRVELGVSKGTYIRSIARDIGVDLGCPAHLSRLERTKAGSITEEDCVTLEALQSTKQACALDPVRILGFRFAFIKGEAGKLLDNGGSFDQGSLMLHEYDSARYDICACTSGVKESAEPPSDDELISMVHDNKLKAIYRFDRAVNRYKPVCVFQIGVIRGFDG